MKNIINIKIDNTATSANLSLFLTRCLKLEACGFKDKISTVHYSKQLVLNTFFSISFSLHRGETPDGKGVKKTSRSVAIMQHGEACVFHPSSCRLNGKPMDVELTIRAC